MSRLIMVAMCLLICAASKVSAHDIGVTEVSFQEYAAAQYHWVVENPGGVRDVITPPELPQNCTFIASKIRNEIRPEFHFRCHPGLTTHDVIKLFWRSEMLLVKAKWLNGVEQRSVFLRRDEMILVELGRLSATTETSAKVSFHYVNLGVEHILTGIDHLLFVLCIMLLVSKLKTLIGAITAFTLAHSLSLGLSFFNIVSLNSAPVEACIAFSIVVLACDIIYAHRGKPGVVWRYPWLVCGGFGLLHGLGFAGALADVGVPQAEVSLALLFFNMGVELGQLAFVLVVISAAFIWLKVRASLQFARASLADIRLVAAYLIGSLAMFWSIERGAVIFS